MFQPLLPKDNLSKAETLQLIYTRGTRMSDLSMLSLIISVMIHSVSNSLISVRPSNGELLFIFKTDEGLLLSV